LADAQNSRSTPALTTPVARLAAVSVWVMSCSISPTRLWW
jgi:hypothetical protein